MSLGTMLDARNRELANAQERIRELEAALRSVPRYAFPGQEEFWAKIDVLLGDATQDRTVES
jgi:hypothetical protein